MKKTFKLFSLLLVACLVMSMAVVSAFAISSEDDLASNYANQLKPAGANNYFAYTDHYSSWGIASYFGSSAIAEKTTVDGNTYTSFHYRDKGDFPNTNGSYYSIKAGSSSYVMGDYAFAFNNAIQHSAIVYDMDIMPDRYRVATVVDGVTTYKTYTPAELSAAGISPDDEGVEISYFEKDSTYFSVRFCSIELESTTSSPDKADLQSASMHVYYVKDADGNWYYSNNKNIGSATHLVPVSGVGTFDHVTAVLYPQLYKSGDTVYTLLSGAIFVNGETVCNGAIVNSSKKALSIWLDEVRLNILDTTKNAKDSYSYAVDNYTLNYYGANYASEGYGIDDLIAEGRLDDYSIFNCTDVVCTKDYISPNGYVQVQSTAGNGNLVSLPYAVNEQISLLKTGDTLYTTMDLPDLDIPEGVESLFIKCDNSKIKVTASEKLSSRGYAVKKATGGYIVELSDDYVTAKIYDAVGNLIEETTVGFGAAPNLTGINPSAVADGVIKYTTSPEWEWSLGGEIGKVTTTLASPGDVITIRPKASSITTVSGATFAMGNYDENYRFIPAMSSSGNYTLYQNATGDTLIKEIAAAKNGRVAILLADFTSLSGDATAISGIAAKNLEAGSYSLDLNGHMLAKIGLNDSDQIPLFALKNGSTLNVYSSKAGGELLIGSVKPTNTSQVNQICSGGIAYISNGVNSATLNVGALIDEKGNTVYDGDNLSFTGGSILIYQGSKTSEDLSAGKLVNINLIGGSYFVAFRGSYSFITLQSPGANILVDGIKLYGTYSSTSLIHEYTGFSTHGTKAVIRNSEIYGTYVISEAYYGNYSFYNNTLVGKTKIINKNGNAASIKIGAGNKFSSNAAASFFKLNIVSFEEGVVMLTPKSGSDLATITKDFVHIDAALNWADSLDFKLKDGAVIDGVVDTNAEAGLVSSVSFKESLLKTKKTDHLSYTCYSITVSADNVPDGVSVIEWQTADGKVLKTTYQFAGDKVEVPAECVPYSTDYGWHSDVLSWNAVASAKSGKSIEKPTAKSVANIVGILQNATLFSDMTYNLYLPVNESVTNVSVSGASLGGIVEVLEGKYYVISATPGVNYFDPINATISYKVDGKDFEYGVTFDIIKYASAVADYYICGSEEAILVYEILAFKKAVATFVDPSFTPTGALAEYFNAHAACNCNTTSDALKSSDLAVGYDNLSSKGVSGAAYVLDSAKFDFVIYVDGNTKIDSVSYKNALGKVITHTEELGNLVKKDGRYVVTGISAAYIDNVMTISVGGESGTYSLAKYISNTTDASAKAVAIALYTYARAAEEFKNISTTEHKFTISFDTDGGDAMSSIKVLGGKCIPTPATPKKFKYVFVEWQLDGETYDFETPVTSDITLTAVWRKAEDNEMYDRMQSVLLIGQSNMVGIGLMSTVEPIEDDRLFMMNKTTNEWVKMQEPLFGYINARSGVSLGASFGKAFVETFGCDVGLIAAAQGSTTLEDWAVGGDLYSDAVRLAKIAQENSDIAAILWHQGEGNQNSTDYAAKLRVILDSMLEELGLDPNKIIIITGELFGTRSDAVHMDQLIELGTHYPNYDIALSDGLTVLDVTTHFDGPSLRVFGYRYFAKFYKLLTGRTYEYDDNPANYWASQIPSTDYTYIPFDDMLTGNACTGYTGSGMLTVNGDKGVGYIYSDGTTNRYLSAANFVKDKNTVNNSVYFDSHNNAKDLGYGGVVAVQAMIKLGEDHNHAVSIFDMYTENSTAVYSNFYVDASGNLYVVDASGNKTKVLTLTTSTWVSIKVILDTESNLKDIYVNDEIVLRGVKISNNVDPSTLVIDRTRLIDFSVDSSSTKGCILFDEYRFTPYFDNLQPGS